MPYTVRVAENSHYMDESEAYDHGTYPTREAAQAACHKIVDDFLTQSRKPSMSADALFKLYTSFAIITRRDDVAGVPGRYGWDGGYGTSAYVDPREDMVAILMTQRVLDAPKERRSTSISGPRRIRRSTTERAALPYPVIPTEAAARLPRGGAVKGSHSRGRDAFAAQAVKSGSLRRPDDEGSGARPE